MFGREKRPQTRDTESGGEGRARERRGGGKAKPSYEGRRRAARVEVPRLLPSSSERERIRSHLINPDGSSDVASFWQVAAVRQGG